MPQSQADMDSAMQEAGDRLFKAFQSYHNHNNSYSFQDESSSSSSSSSHLSNKIAALDSSKESKDLLYDPTSIVQTENYKILHSRPQLLSSSVPPTFNGHNSLEILSALTDHASQMSKIEDQFNLNKNFKDSDGKTVSSGSSFHGQDSEELTKAFIEYAKTHDALPQDFLKSLTDSNQASSKAAANVGDDHFNLATSGNSVGKESATLSGSVVGSSVFSLATLASSMQWARIIYGIVWISLGLFLVFFGWASYNWTTRPRSQTGKKIGSKDISSRAILGGGIGGTVVGFLFMSMLSTLIVCAVCSSGERPSPSSTAFFVIWLVPGLLGAALGGHLRIVGRLMAGLAAGASSTLILTAMFGIHTLLIRIVLIAVLCPILTSPLLLPRTTMIQKHLLNASTSIFGMLILLDGVSLFAPPKESSDSWLNLWVLLFSGDESASKDSIIQAWGTGSFKGYIAGAVLGSIIGFLFEFFFHKHAAENADEEWNDYLGTYTSRFEKNGSDLRHGGSGMPGAFDGSRAGLFEPSPNVFARIGDFFAGNSKSEPASYGNLPGGQNTSPLTERSSSKRSRARSSRSKATTTRSAKTKRGTPARFEALGKRDLDLEACQESDEEDSDATEFDSDDDLSNSKAKDKDGNSLQNFGGYSLPVLSGGGLKPPGLLESPSPSYRTSGTESLTNTSSTLSGSTKQGSITNGGGSEVHKPLDVYRDKDVTSTSQVDSNGQKIVAATPSLINAISRIQQAQAQARAWQAQQQNSPYGSQNKDEEKEKDSSK